jgi:hypothetical protein
MYDPNDGAAAAAFWEDTKLVRRRGPQKNAD